MIKGLGFRVLKDIGFIGFMVIKGIWFIGFRVKGF